MPRKRRPRSGATLDTIRYLSGAPSGKVVKSVLQAAPDSVIKVISNAALNAAQGRIRLTPSQRKHFATRKPLFRRLISPAVSVEAKRQALVRQSGGAFPFIPLLLGAVFGTLGSTLLRNIGKKSE